MAIKINWSDISKRMINGREVSKVMMNGVQIRGTPWPTPPSVDAWIYWNQTLWLISFSMDGTNWTTISDKNLWASVVYETGDTLSESNCWYFYQRWNNYGFPWDDVPITTSTTTVYSIEWYWPWNYYNDGTFILRNDRIIYNSPWYDTVTPNPNNGSNLWWWVTNTNASKQWPCPSWFHIPSLPEITTWYTILNYIENQYILNYEQACDLFKMPATWTRYEDDGLLYRDPTWPMIFFRCATINSNLYTASYLRCRKSIGWFIECRIINLGMMCDGYPIRPFKNDPVVPSGTWWTALYLISN